MTKAAVNEAVRVIYKVQVWGPDGGWREWGYEGPDFQEALASADRKAENWHSRVIVGIADAPRA